MEKSKRFMKLPILIIMVCVFILSASVYFVQSKTLPKPANFSETVQFLLENPKGYGLSLTFGAIAKIVTLLMVCVTVGAIITLLCNVFDGRFEKNEMYLTLFSFVVTFLMLFIQNKILKSYWSILGVALVIVGCVYGWIKSK